MPSVLAARGGMVNRSGRVAGNLVEAVALWCEALQGDTPIRDAVAGLTLAVGAEAGALVRARGGDRLGTLLAASDRGSGGGARRLTRSFAAAEFGPDFGRAKSGSVWVASQLRSGEPDPELGEWAESRKVSDLAALVLAQNGERRDHLEFHFALPLAAGEDQLLSLFAPTIARTWAARRNVTLGGATQALRSSAQSRLIGRDPILGPSNPARLSRAEFRVCLLLSRGFSVQGVSDELGLAEATIRSHLRSVYAKTGTAGLAQLVFRLLAGTENSGGPASRIA
ncbi:MAG: LuxR C-terminal-related transcriptional regulator [Paracoccaceae bacterium]